MVGAENVTNTYFEHQYMDQIIASGEQVRNIPSWFLYQTIDRAFHMTKPLEAARTRPYHYRAYNLAAMIVCHASFFPRHLCSVGLSHI